ncbi:MAG: hypothetical protein ACI8QZ_000158 [Chlamydiales bacterium]|jgi:hypothetical protein
MSSSQTSVNPISVLPQGWQPDRDILVLVGADHAGVAALFRAHGQQRIVSYLAPEDACAADGCALVVRDHESLREYIQSLSGTAPELASVNAITGASVDPALLKELPDLIGKALRTWKTGRNTVDHFGGLWMQQMVQNMTELASHPSVDELSGLFSDRPCVIVSPGPSLDKNIGLLKDLAGRALIMTCPHALQALDEIGVVPDIVVVGDAQALAWQYGDYDFSRVPALVLMASSSPDLFDLPAQQIFTYGFHPEVDLWAFEFLGKDAFLSTGGSVACSEFSLAHRMGCPQVAFIGQDLALEGARYYAASTRDGESVASFSEDGEFVLERQLPVDGFNRWGLGNVPAPSQKTFEVPGYHGGTVTTPRAFAVFIDWFVGVLASDECSAEVFNCTEGGAYIDGMQHVPLAEFLRGLTDTSLPVSGEQLADCATRWDRAHARTHMTRSLVQVMGHLETCRTVGRSCLKLVRSARGDESRLKRLSKEESRLSRALKSVPFLAVMAQEEIRKASDAGAAATDVQSNLDASERLFRVVLEAVEAVHAPLSESYRQLRVA